MWIPFCKLRREDCSVCNYPCLHPELYLLPGVIISDVIIVIRAMRLSAYGPFVSNALRSRFFCSSVSHNIVYCACITILSWSLNNICSVC